VEADRLPTKVGCPSCRTVFLAEPEIEARPWYREPIILGSIVFSVLLLLGFAGYVIGDWRFKSRKAEARALKDLADSRVTDSPREALSAYGEYLTRTEEFKVDPVFKVAIQDAQSKKRQLENTLKAQLELEAQQARERELLANQEKQKAEAEARERERAEQEQEELLRVVREKKDERNRLAKIEAKVTGVLF